MFFLRELADATVAKTPTMVPNLPMDITSLAFHLRYLENFDPQLQGYILIHGRPCDNDCWPEACAFWHRTKRGAKKCGPWVLGRLLSWDPSHVGKKHGFDQVLLLVVTSEQLRAAFGFEDWVPFNTDINHCF